MKKERIIIYGGSFDPIHIGHLIIAQTALDNFNAKKVLFVPSKKSAHKDNSEDISDESRLHLMSLSIEDNPQFELSDIEIKRGGISYTIDTVYHFKEYIEEEILFLIGDDLVEGLKDWKNIDKLKEEVEFIVASRKFKNHQIQSYVPVEIFKSPIIEVSSSDIRNRIKKGISIKYLVKEKVRKEIIKRGYYK